MSKVKKNKLDSIRKGIKSKTTSISEKEELFKEKFGTGKIDTNLIPSEWRNVKKDAPKQEIIDMTKSYTERLPRVSITLYNAKNLRKEGAYYVKITVGVLQSIPFVSKVSANKKSTNPDWNEEFVSRVESGPDAFKCRVKIFQSKTMGHDTPMACCEFDLYNDFGIRCAGDKRYWNFPLVPQGEISIQFTAQTDTNFPNMSMNNVDGLPTTVSLPLKPNPEMEIVIYQAIRLQGVKRLNSYVLVEHHTFDFNALPGVKPNKVRPILKTKAFRGNSPFWNERGRVKFLTNEDTIDVTLVYEKGGSSVKGEDKIATLTLKELKKVATATESRRWFAFVGTFKGAVLGIGFKALSNMKAMEGLPDPPPILSVEEWNERQKSGGRHAIPSAVKIDTKSIGMDVGEKFLVQKEEEPDVEDGILDLLDEVRALEGMEDDESENSMFVPVETLPELRKFKEISDNIFENLQRLEIEASKVQLSFEKRKTSEEKYQLSSERNRFADEKANLLEGGISSLAKQDVKSSINNILLNLDGSKSGNRTNPSTPRAAGNSQTPRANSTPRTPTKNVLPTSNSGISGNYDFDNSEHAILATPTKVQSVSAGRGTPVTAAGNSGNLQRSNTTPTTVPPIGSTSGNTNSPQLSRVLSGNSGGSQSGTTPKINLSSSSNSAGSTTPRRPATPTSNNSNNNNSNNNNNNIGSSAISPRSAVNQQNSISNNISPRTGSNPPSNTTWNSNSASVNSSSEKIAQCSLCKLSFPQSEMFVLKGKPFCAGCKQRLIETAQKRVQQ